jgi:predicted 2-oxoglutarate/Fe(II)-dependent dioxygenase YbiX/alkylated DNA repair dioxygenase AlkB
MNKTLLEQNYLLIPNFISLEHAKELSDNLKEDHKKNKYEGDSQAPNSACVYNHEGSRKLLHEKINDLSLIVESQLLPTYVYSRIYSNGEELKSHTDRPACELTVSVNLDADADWPIYICDHNNEPQEVIMKPGDGVVFLGCYSPHWRHKFEGTFCSQVFLHYVRADGAASCCVDDSNRGEIDEPFVRRTVAEEYVKMGWRPPPHVITEMKNIYTGEPQYVNDLMDGIVYYKHVFSKEQCKELMDYFDDNSSLWQPALTTGDMMEGNEESKVRKCDLIEISASGGSAKEKDLDNKLFEFFNTQLNDYVSRFNHLTIETDSGYTMLRYRPGGEYIEHVDHGTKTNRALTAILGLNDDYEGGELHFWGGKYKMKIEAGSAVFFPATFLYPHRVCPVESGTRYSIVTWFV